MNPPADPEQQKSAGVGELKAANHFFAYLYRLRLVQRWGLMRNMVKESVAEHTFHVAVLTHALCTIGTEVFGKTLDTERAVTLALFHDLTEVITGDMPSPVKHQNPMILAALRNVENLAAERLLETIPQPLDASYRRLMGTRSQHETAADATLWPYVHAADKLDGYLKCVVELSMGNKEYSVARREFERVLRESQLDEVGYFLDTFAPSFEMTLDEITYPR